MSTIAQIPSDVAERGRKLYQEKLKDILEPAEIGKFVAIEPDTEQYFVADEDIDAIMAGRAALPGKFFYLMRIGYRTTHKIGGAAHPIESETKRTKAQMPADLGARGKAFYEEKLQAILEPEHNGKFVAIEPYIGQYFVGERDIDAGQAARAALPGHFFYFVRIGYEVAYSIGGAMYPRGKRPTIDQLIIRPGQS